MTGVTRGLLSALLLCACGGAQQQAPTAAPRSSAALPNASAPPSASAPPNAAAPEHTTMNYEFRVTRVAERQLMIVHDQAHGDLPTKIVQGLDQVWAYLKSQGAKTGHNVVVYRDFNHATGVMTIDVGVQVETALPGNGTVVPGTTPAGLVATTVHIGPYQKLGDASSALHQFCAANDHPIAGPTWEDYGDWNSDPSQLRTDVFVLVAR